MGRAFEKVSRQCGGGCAWSRARSNAHEPYLIANGVCGGAASATATVDGENCAGVVGWVPREGVGEVVRESL